MDTQATGFHGWRVSAALRPSRQAHGNALLSPSDAPGSHTSRCVFYTTGREAAAVRRTRPLPARDRAALATVLAHDLSNLEDIEPTTADNSTALMQTCAVSSMVFPAS